MLCFLEKLGALCISESPDTQCTGKFLYQNWTRLLQPFSVWSTFCCSHPGKWWLWSPTQSLKTDDFLNESETDDFTLTSRKRPSIQLPVEIRKGLSPELFSTDRKALIRHMWACDESVLFKHQATLLQLIRENLGKAFAISFEATTGAGKTASILSVAGLLASTEYKLMYVCPSEQRAVRLEVGQLLFSCTTVTSEALFVWAELPQGKLSLTYDEHAMAQVSNAQTKTDRGYGVWSRGNVGEIHCRTHWQVMVIKLLA